MRSENERPDCLKAVMDKGELYTNFGFKYRDGPPFWYYETEADGYRFPEKPTANLFDDVCASGCMNCSTDDVLGRLCNFVDMLTSANLLSCADFVSLTFDGRHFAPASAASHIAYFFASNPTFGVSPKSARIVTGGMIDDNIDLFDNAYVLERTFRDEVPDGHYQMLRDMKRRYPTRTFPPRSWLKSNIDRFSLVFNHRDGIECVHRALGVYDFPEVLHHVAKKIVDSVIAGHMFEMDPRDAGDPWKYNWHTSDDDFPGKRLWNAFNNVDHIWREMIRDDRSVRLAKVNQALRDIVGVTDTGELERVMKGQEV